MANLNFTGKIKLRKLGRIRDNLGNESRQALFKIGKDYKATANAEILHGKKSGRVYNIPTNSKAATRTRTGKRRTRKHRASAPGETHANMRGTLRRSIGWKVRGYSQLTFGYGATADAEKAPDYAKVVETGGVNMKARPSLKNSINSNRRNTMRHLERAMKKSLQL